MALNLDRLDELRANLPRLIALGLLLLAGAGLAGAGVWLAVMTRV